MDDVRQVIRRENLNVRGGPLERGKRRETARTEGQFRTLQEIEDVIVAYRDGQPITVGDFAAVRDSFKEQTTAVRQNGRDTVVLVILRRTGSNTLKVVERVEKEIERVNERLLGPQGLELHVVYKDSTYIDESIGTVWQNLAIGAVLATAVLLLFLRSGRSTIIIGLSIPISLIGTFIFVQVLGRTLNIVSLAGLGFAEKLNISIDYFNALRNVSVAPGADADAASSQAHSMGELVGGALRDLGACPVELDLIPESVKAASVIAAKKPFLWTATAVLVLSLAGVGMYFKKASGLTVTKAADRTQIEADLKRHDTSIEEFKVSLAELEVRKDPYVRAAFDRAYWLEIFRDLNERMDSDKMWITVMEPLSEGLEVTDPPQGSNPDMIASTAGVVEGERKTITQLIKVVAYRTETCLAKIVEPFFARHDDEARAFLKTVFRLPGDITPDHERHELRVSLYGLANNRSQQALVALCEHLNTQDLKYPGTNLRLVYSAIQSHSN